MEGEAMGRNQFKVTLKAFTNPDIDRHEVMEIVCKAIESQLQVDYAVHERNRLEIVLTECDEEPYTGE